MPKLIISLDGIIVKEVDLTRDRVTIGRDPYNDVVLEHLTVSGEHALLQTTKGRTTLEDLGSTNGTYLNGKRISKEALGSGDQVEIGMYKIRYRTEDASGAKSSADAGALAGTARLRVLSGAKKGREMALVKRVTTLGKHGISVAAITRTGAGFELSHVEGLHAPDVNGVSAMDGPIRLQSGDEIRMGDVRLAYIQD